MDHSLTIQYILIAIIVLAACYALFKFIRKNFAPKKFNSKGTSCDRDCGCS